MKRYKIINTLALTMFILAGNAQNKPTAASKPAATQKIICSECKTPFPYNHSIDKGLADRAGNIWFGTSEGVYRYDGKLFTNYKVMGGLNVATIANIVEDNAGNIWFGTQGGAIRYNKKSFTNIMTRAGGPLDIPGGWGAEGSTKIEGQYTSVFPDRSGNIWFCSGYDLFIYDEGSQTALHTGLGRYLNETVPDKSAFHDASVQLAYQDKKGNIWFTVSGCSTPLHDIYRLDGRRLNNVCVLNKCKHDLNNSADHAAHNREIAASVTRMTKADGTGTLAYTAILEDSHGNMWFGTWENGLYRCDDKTLTHFTGRDGLDSANINTIYEDKAGNLWFGTGDRNQTQGNGVYRYDGKSIAHFTNKAGLCNTGAFRNNIVSSITEDNRGNLWFGGYGGVCHYNGETFTNFTKMDGFNEEPVNCIVKDKAGNIWFGTWELGLYRYDGKNYTSFTERTPNSQ